MVPAALVFGLAMWLKGKAEQGIQGFHYVPFSHADNH
jgi:hypothetical protein